MKSENCQNTVLGTLRRLKEFSILFQKVLQLQELFKIDFEIIKFTFRMQHQGGGVALKTNGQFFFAIFAV